MRISVSKNSRADKGVPYLDIHHNNTIKLDKTPIGCKYCNDEVDILSSEIEMLDDIFITFSKDDVYK